MSTRATSLLSAALGQIRYRLALAVIGFGVFMGGLLVCILPLSFYVSYFEDGAISETFGRALTGCISLIPVGLTYHYRGWIIRKALEEAPPEPVRIWTGEDVVHAGFAVIKSAFGLAGLLIALVVTLVFMIVAALLVYGGYLLLTMLSVPMAVLIGAIIIALAILIAASA
jgi:hypothetical protein